MKNLLFWISLSFLLLTGCDKNDDDDVQPPPSNDETKHVVQLVDNAFSPENLTVKVGDVVEWVNSGSMIHTSTSGTGCSSDGTWNSGNLNPGGTFSFTFTDEGSFDYYCIPHCQLGMTGNVSVEE